LSHIESQNISGKLMLITEKIKFFSINLPFIIF
ncbi:MAG: hypothetical protein ACI9WH_001468, partial [Glaciecola sp.]